MVTRRVRLFIAQQGLLAPGDRTLVALSGGADSVALLRLLMVLGYGVEAAHANFCLRGEESKRDEAFVRGLCRKLGVVLHVTTFDTRAEAARRGISIEMTARDLRYDWLEQLRKQRGLQAIAVGHHRDDSAETMLMNLIRGTGINGLRGIAPRRGRIIRPLLCLSREEVVGYLQGIGQDYVTDSTNLCDDFTRNKVRLHILPALREINPSVVDALLNTARHLEQAARICRQALDEGAARTCHWDLPTSASIDIDRLRQEPSPEALLHHLLAPLGFNGAQVDDLMRCLEEGQAGRRFNSKDWEVVRDRERLLLEKRLQDNETPSRTLHMEVCEVTPDFILPRDPHIACLDLDRLTLPLSLRRWQQGDGFIPLGMRGRKLVSDLLTDCKLSLPERDRQMVVCSANGDIVWVVGLRIDQRYRVTEGTRRVALLTVG